MNKTEREEAVEFVGTVMSFDRFNTQLELIVKLLQVSMKMAGVTITDDEALRYLLWVDNALFVTLLRVGGDDFSNSARAIQTAIVESARRIFKASKTGQFDPPTPDSFMGETHEVAEEKLQAIIGDLTNGQDRSPLVPQSKREWVQGGYL